MNLECDWLTFRTGTAGFTNLLSFVQSGHLPEEKFN